MKLIDPNELGEATRLTSAGQLSEATMLLQRALAGLPRSEIGAFSRKHAMPDLSTLLRGEVLQAPAYGSGEGKRGGLRSLLSRLTRSTGGLDLARNHNAPPAENLTPAGSHFSWQTYRNEAGSREYRLFVPSGYTGQTVPLVVMLHGCTQSPDDFAAGTGMNLLAEEQTFLVAYPAQPQSANIQKCWNWFNPADQQRGAGEPALIAGITQQIMAEHAVDARRVYIAGLSAGGAAAAIMGRAYPDLYAAVGVHSGLACGSASDLPSALAAMRQGSSRKAARSGDRPSERNIPVIVFHGDNDATVHPRNGEDIISQAANASPSALSVRIEHGQAGKGRTYRRSIHAGQNGQVASEEWVVHGAGHAWSGGSSAGTYTDSQGPDASSEMVRFFLEHPLP